MNAGTISMQMNYASFVDDTKNDTLYLILKVTGNDIRTLYNKSINIASCEPEMEHNHDFIKTMFSNEIDD